MPKVKHETLRKFLKFRGLKNVDTFEETVSFQCSWVHKLFDYNFHDWKVVAFYSVKKHRVRVSILTKIFGRK